MPDFRLIMQRIRNPNPNTQIFTAPIIFIMLRLDESRAEAMRGTLYGILTDFVFFPPPRF